MKRDELLEQALAALPPMSEERRQILQPSADEELFACFIQVRSIRSTTSERGTRGAKGLIYRARTR